MKFTVSAVVTVAASVLLLAGCHPSTGTASANFSNSHSGYEGSGPIHPYNENGWCLTAPLRAIDGDPLFIEPCIVSDANQMWQVIMTTGSNGNPSSGVGLIGLRGTEFVIGQRGTLNLARVITHVDEEDTSAYYYVTLRHLQNEWWTITLPYKGVSYLTSPLNPQVRVKIYSVTWDKSQAPRQSNQNWEMPQLEPVH